MSQFQALSDFLSQDPTNAPLRRDCASAAIDENLLDEAKDILQPLIDQNDPAGLSLMGLIHMKEGDFSAAAKLFSDLKADMQTEDPSLSFNLAWSYAHLKQFDEALELLTDDVARALPQAAMFRVQLLHQLEEFDSAAETAREYLELFPDYEGLIAATSTLAMDIEDADWAAKLAKKAPDHPEAKITLATLHLSADSAQEASDMFDDVLQKQPKAPRALIGKGLAQLLLSDNEQASELLDQGAASFGTHLGSWIAAGWSYAVRGDLTTARERFETALKVDDTFAEIHGSLGVLDVMEGQIETGQKRLRTARRLDPDCASAALGQMLVLQGQGREQAIQKIFEKAMSTPIDESGTTLSQAMVRMGMM